MAGRAQKYQAGKERHDYPLHYVGIPAGIRFEVDPARSFRETQASVSRKIDRPLRRLRHPGEGHHDGRQ
jgi:hypothetical protein